jgi:hypothetical protein
MEICIGTLASSKSNDVLNNSFFPHLKVTLIGTTQQYLFVLLVRDNLNSELNIAEII